MSLELSTDRVVCTRCGTAFSKRDRNFSVNYGAIYRGTTHLSVCKACVERIFEGYLEQCNDSRLAVRQTCRKLDLYWDNKIYDSIASKATLRSVMSQYIQCIAKKTYFGKSYDDTLEAEGRLWSFADDTTKLYVSDNGRNYGVLGVWVHTYHVQRTRTKKKILDVKVSERH